MIAILLNFHYTSALTMMMIGAVSDPWLLRQTIITVREQPWILDP